MIKPALKKKGVRSSALRAFFSSKETALTGNQTSYAHDLDYWRPKAHEGLFDQEKKLLQHCEIPSGNTLCLGCGTGREVFALAEKGFSVTGVDQVESFIQVAQQIAAEKSIAATFLQQDLTHLNLPPQKFDFITCWNNAYSYIPTRNARVRLLLKLKSLLAPGSGKCALNFLVKKPSGFETAIAPLLKGIAPIVKGNTEFQAGDRLQDHGAFLHFFPSKETVGEEAREAGFQKIDYFCPFPDSPYVILSL